MKTLRPYQREDANRLIQLGTAGCFNEQRTGKTPTSIVAMTALANKIAIVAPASMLLPWRDAFMEWSGRPCLVYDGTEKQRSAILDKWEHGLVLSYEMFRGTKNKPGLVEIITAKKTKCEGIIFDEAHRMSGRKTTTFSAAKQTRRTPYRFFLTGTPAPSHPSQIWNYLTLIAPQAYSSYWAFIDDFFEVQMNTIWKGRGRKEEVREIMGFKPGAEERLATIINIYCIQRKRKDVMPWLPDIDPPTRIRLDLTTQQKKYLDELSDMYETEHVIVQGTLDRIIRYRQVCNAPALLGLKGGSPKMDWIHQYIVDYPNTPIIIFSRFAKFIELLAKEIPDSVMITGDVTKLQRKQIIQEFQNGMHNVLLCQLDAAKEGLTLDRAETIIVCDKYPPSGDYAQAYDRFVATSEEKANIPKVIVELMMADSFDQELFELVDKNTHLTDIVNNYKQFLNRR